MQSCGGYPVGLSDGYAENLTGEGGTLGGFATIYPPSLTQRDTMNEVLELETVPDVWDTITQMWQEEPTMPDKHFSTATLSMQHNGKTISADLDDLNELLEHSADPRIIFPATYHRQATDSDCETTLQLKIPASNRGEMAQMMAMTNTVLEITVRVKPSMKQGELPLDDDDNDN